MLPGGLKKITAKSIHSVWQESALSFLGKSSLYASWIKQNYEMQKLTL